jgi:hypothetical protein
MIENRAEDGLDPKDWIECAFHVVFPGHSDECDCKLRILNEYVFFEGGFTYTLYVDGCDCIHITAFEPPEETPKEGLVWPCRPGESGRLRGCVYAPQMKLIVASN